MENVQPITVLMSMISPGLRGGPPGHLPFLVDGLKENGVNVIKITYGARKDFENPLEKIINTLISIVNFNLILLRKDVNIIHLNSAFDKNSFLRDFATIFFIRLYKIPIVLKTHGTDAKFILHSGNFIKYLQNLVFKWVDKIGVLSYEEKMNFEKAGLSSNKVIQIKNIVNNEYFTKKSNVRELYGLNDLATPLLLFSARFIPQKGLITVLEACQIIHETGAKFHLFCLGDGPDMKSAKEIVRLSGMHNKVTFTGYILEESTKPFYSAADIFVFPTYFDEGFPMALFQSVAGGACIITTRIRAAADYLSEPNNCLWVDAKDPKALALNIEKLIGDSELRKSMRCNNIEVGKTFDKTSVACEFIDIYRKLLSINERVHDLVIQA